MCLRGIMVGWDALPFRLIHGIYYVGAKMIWCRFFPCRREDLLVEAWGIIRGLPGWRLTPIFRQTGHIDLDPWGMMDDYCYGNYHRGHW